MTRAVIELSGNIGSILPALNKFIAGYRYNPEEKTASFYQDNACVIVEPERLTIYNVADEDAAKNLVDNLKRILNKLLTG